jgi:hypothetical protein
MLKQKNSRKFVSYRHITKNLIQLNPYEFWCLLSQWVEP